MFIVASLASIIFLSGRKIFVDSSSSNESLEVLLDEDKKIFQNNTSLIFDLNEFDFGTNETSSEEETLLTNFQRKRETSTGAVPACFYYYDRRGTFQLCVSISISYVTQGMHVHFDLNSPQGVKSARIKDTAIYVLRHLRYRNRFDRSKKCFYSGVRYMSKGYNIKLYACRRWLKLYYDVEKGCYIGELMTMLRGRGKRSGSNRYKNMIYYMNEARNRPNGWNGSKVNMCLYPEDDDEYYYDEN